MNNPAFWFAIAAFCFAIAPLLPDEPEERVVPPVQSGQCECNQIVCQVCPAPEDYVERGWCEERGWVYE